MKILSFFAPGIVFLTLGCGPCHAQNPEAALAAPVPGPANSPIPDGPDLETRIFEVPSEFFLVPTDHTPADPAADPFAGDPAKHPRPIRNDIKILLQQLGIEFNAPGSGASRGPGRREITVTNTPEQLDNVESVITPIGSSPPRQSHVHLEVFSLPPLTARKALITHPKEGGLHAWLDAELAKPDGQVKLERHSITLVRGWQRAKIEAAAEIPRATEYSQDTIPHRTSQPTTAGLTTPSADSTGSVAEPRATWTPKAFESRNAGDTFEMELAFGDDGQSIDLNLAPETTRRLGIVKSGPQDGIRQPVFETQRCATQASGLLGQPMLISTFSPPVNTGVPGANRTDRTWLLFITVTEPK